MYELLEDMMFLHQLCMHWKKMLTHSAMQMQGRAPGQAKILSDSSSSLTYYPVWNGYKCLFSIFLGIENQVALLTALTHATTI